jgi:hypothetical protein
MTFIEKNTEGVTMLPYLVQVLEMASMTNDLPALCAPTVAMAVMSSLRAVVFVYSSLALR